MVFAIYIIICTKIVNTFQINSAGRAEIDCEFIKSFIVGHLGRVKVDQFITVIAATMMKNYFMLISTISKCCYC